MAETKESTPKKTSTKKSSSSVTLTEFKDWAKETETVISATLKQYSGEPTHIAERQAVLAIKKQFQKKGSWQA